MTACLRALFFLTLLGLAACTTAPTLSTYSQDHLYNENAAVALVARRLDGNAYERIYLRLTFRSLADGTPAAEIARRYRANYQVGAGYDGTGLLAQDSLQLQRMVYLGKRSYALTFNIAKPEASAVVMFTVEDRVSRTPFVFDLPLPAPDVKGEASYKYLTFNRSGTRPLYGPFARPGDTISVRSLTLTNKPIILRQYIQDFPPALPPMAITANIISGGEKPIAAARYALPPNTQVVLASPGTYILSEDTLSDPGQAIVVAPHNYPDLSRASELVAPLTYITTRAERIKLVGGKYPKQEVDKFWLGIAGTKENARRLIAAYYANVEYANAWFTDYREGFKTDRGMVFIIFGKPSQVLRSGPVEEWRYEERGITPELRFFFEKREAPLGPQTWQLRRSPDYDRFWYAVVDQWRKGVSRR
jgi:GWxTD domain-containing protein